MNLLFMDLNLNIFSFALKCYFTSTLSSIYKGLVHYGSIKGNLEFMTSSIFYNSLTESGIRAFFFFFGMTSCTRLGAFFLDQNLTLVGAVCEDESDQPMQN